MTDVQADEAAPSRSGGTWPLADVATVTMRGGDIPEPGSQEEELILAAWKLYYYIRGEALRNRSPETVKYGRTGFSWRGELPDAYRFLWPAGASPIPALKPGDARTRITTWLCTNQDLAPLNQGNDGSAGRKGAILPQASVWWVAEDFRGAPPGLRLPETEAKSAASNGWETKLDAILAGAPEPEPAPARAAAQEPREWWCPFADRCGLDEPVTKRGLGIHLNRMHGLKSGTEAHAIVMEQAEQLRTSNSSLLPAFMEEPAIAGRELPEPSRPVAPEPAPAPVRTPAPAPAAPVQAAPVPAGTVTAQARVFAGEVARLEEENLRLRNENAALREENAALRRQGGGNQDEELREMVRKLARITGAQ